MIEGRHMTAFDLIKAFSGIYFGQNDRKSESIRNLKKIFLELCQFLWRNDRETTL